MQRFNPKGVQGGNIHNMKILNRLHVQQREISMIERGNEVPSSHYKLFGKRIFSGIDMCSGYSNYYRISDYTHFCKNRYYKMDSKKNDTEQETQICSIYQKCEEL